MQCSEAFPFSQYSLYRVTVQDATGGQTVYAVVGTTKEGALATAMRLFRYLNPDRMPHGGMVSYIGDAYGDL